MVIVSAFMLFLLLHSLGISKIGGLSSRSSLQIQNIYYENGKNDVLSSCLLILQNLLILKTNANSKKKALTELYGWKYFLPAINILYHDLYCMVHQLFRRCQQNQNDKLHTIEGWGIFPGRLEDWDWETGELGSWRQQQKKAYLTRMVSLIWQSSVILKIGTAHECEFRKEGFALPNSELCW